MLLRANYQFLIREHLFDVRAHRDGGCVCFDHIGARRTCPLTPVEQLLNEIGLSPKQQAVDRSEFCIRFEIPPALAQRIIENSQFAQLEDDLALAEELAIDREMEPYFWQSVNPFLESPFPTLG